LHCRCDAKTYPIAKKKMTLEYLRSVSHLRARTNTIASVSRIRNGLSFATHTFFQKHGFQYIHTPIITCSDCEGAGEMFQVSNGPSTNMDPFEHHVPCLMESPWTSTEAHWAGWLSEHVLTGFLVTGWSVFTC